MATNCYVIYGDTALQTNFHTISLFVIPIILHVIGPQYQGKTTWLLLTRLVYQATPSSLLIYKRKERSYMSIFQLIDLIPLPTLHT